MAEELKAILQRLVDWDRDITGPLYEDPRGLGAIVNDARVALKSSAPAPEPMIPARIVMEMLGGIAKSLRSRSRSTADVAVGAAACCVAYAIEEVLAWPEIKTLSLPGDGEKGASDGATNSQ